MKKQIILLLLLCTFIYAKIITEAEEKMIVLQLLKTYSKTVACNLLIDEKNIFTIERDTEYGLATYYAVWSGDKGCRGGSSTTSFYISEIHRDNSNRPFLVINDNAFGKHFSEINTRFIESVKQLNSNNFRIIVLQYAKGDANCCPSLKYQYTVSKKYGEWIVSEGKLLK